LKIGLTGGIGCGKSTVVKLFGDAGWRTIESDAIVRELFAQNQAVRSALQERWGQSILNTDGVIQRKVIAQRVFTDDAELNWLENLLHPLVRVTWESAIAAAPDEHWLIEIPLLFEKRLETHFDLTVCVICSPDTVDNRMVSRGYTGAEIEQRRLRQMPLTEKARRADCVISNDGSLDFLKQQTTRLIAQA
jgi:dephospho-CoA kinase